MFWPLIGKGPRRVAPDLDRRRGKPDASHSVRAPAILREWVSGRQRFKERLSLVAPATIQMREGPDEGHSAWNRPLEPARSSGRPRALLKVNQLRQIRESEWLTREDGLV